jgi:hypothetical protein
MSGLKKSRRLALECLRLKADCMELAGDAPSVTLQRHFLRMAKEWENLAEHGLTAGAKTALSADRVGAAFADARI